MIHPHADHHLYQTWMKRNLPYQLLIPRWPAAESFISHLLADQIIISFSFLCSVHRAVSIRGIDMALPNDDGLGHHEFCSRRGIESPETTEMLEMIKAFIDLLS
jgi:hypothetical protein